MAGRTTCVFVAVIALAACGGSGVADLGTEPAGGTETVTTGPVPDPPLQPQDRSTWMIEAFEETPRILIADAGRPGEVLAVFLDDGSEFPLSETADVTEPMGFMAYSDPPAIYAVVGVTPSGEGRSYAVIRTGQSPPVYDYVSQRVSETTVPTKGSAIYDGSYMGLWVNAGSQQVDAHIVGGAILNVDFDRKRLRGSIVNRRTTDGARFENLSLIRATVVDGTFEGVAQGGQLEGTPSASGSYFGLFVGSDGQEAVGNVIVTHGPRFEMGAFVTRDEAAPALP
jgi:hypothetical protein